MNFFESSHFSKKRKTTIHKRTGKWVEGVIILTVSFKVRQRSVFKSIWNSLARNGLLSNTSDHLRDVDKRTCNRTKEKVNHKLK